MLWYGRKKNQIHFFSHTTFQWKSCGTSKILISEQHSILMNISYDPRTCIILTWARHSGCVPRIPALWRLRPLEEVYREFENCMGTLAHMERNCLKKKLKSKTKKQNLHRWVWGIWSSDSLGTELLAWHRSGRGRGTHRWGTDLPGWKSVSSSIYLRIIMYVSAYAAADKLRCACGQRLENSLLCM